MGSSCLILIFALAPVLVITNALAADSKSLVHHGTCNILRFFMRNRSYVIFVFRSCGLSELKFWWIDLSARSADG